MNLTSSSRMINCFEPRIILRCNQAGAEMNSSLAAELSPDDRAIISKGPQSYSSEVAFEET